ncbi:MAG: carbohydrate binding family 9 domain-containing protein [Candidatus Marinimicrobia bacterium]|nr:carbohydrate binding family 9 domain-containing protein [Candidatus Neomarinimicrobiota bacterium]
MVSEAKTLPNIDGEVINDEAWKGISAIKTFTQKSPDEGTPSTEQTIVKIMYSEETFYVSVVCYDSEPNKIVITDTRRDAPLNNTDSFMFVLDTYQDQQNGFVFGTNAGGIEYDAQVSGGGEGMSISSTRQSVGIGANFNINWDAAWEVKTKIGDFGWSAEFAIPFKTLRFSSKKNQTWGANFQRTIARRSEHVFWSPIPRQFSLNRLALAGIIKGINVPSSRNLKVMPYILGNNNDVKGEDSFSSSNNDFGLDAKVGLTSSLTLDLTYNTDFAQVEADEQQINLDRFSLFFPEKRGFFLENAGLFSAGENTYYGPDIEMFFSRRIGIVNGKQVPILGGGRLTGNIGGMKVGALNMRTKKVKDVSDGDNYSILRLRKELPNRTHFGAMVTNRQGLGDNGYTNNAYSFDGALGIGEAIQLTAFAAITDPAQNIENKNTYAYVLEANRNTKSFTNQIRYSEVGENFNPGMGFVKRLGYRKVLFRILNRTRPNDLFGLLELRPHITYWGYWKLDNGFQQTGFLHIDNHWEFRNGFRIDTGINFTKEGVEEAFPIVSDVIVPKGTYDNKELHIRTNTNLTKPFSIIIVNKTGGFFSGKRKNTDTTLRYRFGDRFTSEVISKYNDVNLPEGDFITHLIRSRLTYAITPKIYIQSLLQYNNQSDQYSMNWRFIWQQSAATGLYIVYNQSQDYDGIPIANSTKSFVIKYSYLFDALN